MLPIRVASITSYVIDDKGNSLTSIIYHVTDGSLRKVSAFTDKEDILTANIAKILQIKFNNHQTL